MNFYMKCADALQHIKAKKGNFKTTLFKLLEEKKLNEKEFKQAYPILITVMTNLEHIEHLVQWLKDKDPEFNAKNLNFATIMMSEMFFGKYQKLKIGGKISRALKNNKEAIRAEMKSMGLKAAEEDPSTPGAAILRKSIYLRIIKERTSQQKIAELCNGTEKIEKDNLIPNLLKLQYDDYKQLRKNTEYKNSTDYVIQSRSSCLPAYFLCKNLFNKDKERVKKIDIIDCCSAPGNKTSQLAEYWEHGTIFAIERDQKRFELIQNRMEFYQFSNIQCICDSFLNLDPNDPKYENVRYILADPTCSGSGMINNIQKNKQELDKIAGEEDLTQKQFEEFCRIKYSSLEEEEKQKVFYLQKDQLKILNHAAKFPNVIKISYSTCSIYSLEDELVVKQFLEENPKFRLVNLGRYSEQTGFVNDYSEGNKCIRESPSKDGTDGFFVALFKKVSESGEE